MLHKYSDFLWETGKKTTEYYCLSKAMHMIWKFYCFCKWSAVSSRVEIKLDLSFVITFYWYDMQDVKYVLWCSIYLAEVSSSVAVGCSMVYIERAAASWIAFWGENMYFRICATILLYLIWMREISVEIDNENWD